MKTRKTKESTLIFMINKWYKSLFLVFTLLSLSFSFFLSFLVVKCSA